MKRKVRLLLSLTIGFILKLLLFYPIVYAIDAGPAPGGVPTKSLPDMIKTISTVVLGIVGGVAVLVLIIGGFQYITAAGNPDQVGKAKSTIMYAIVGLVICILSYVIVSFVVSSIK